MIKRLKHHQIDKTKWDKIISESDNPHVYALSWYLDIVSPGWQCLIAGDYKYVMPLPIKYKWGVPYLVQPLFCQKNDIFGAGVKDSVAKLFNKNLYWQFPYYNLQTAEATWLGKRRHLNTRINFTLDLTPAYCVLVKDYKENTLRNIRKAQKAKLSVEDGEEILFLDFCKSYLKGLQKDEFIIFNKLVLKAIETKTARIVKALDTQNQLSAMACFLMWNRQIVYLAGASSPEGKDLSAMFLIFDRIIQEYSATGFLLDFEGSMIPGVANFFRGFGSKSSNYYHLKKYLFFYR